jgi:glycine/D-amino acid oxidase-like deaminating enzyme
MRIREADPTRPAFSADTTMSDHPSLLPSTASAVIIGGGVMGASIAYHLAKAGLRDVILLERETFFGQGASGRNAGGIRYQFSTEINVRLSQLSLPMLDAFEAEIGQPIDIRHCGYLFLLTNEVDVESFKENVALQHRLGVPTEWLSPQEIRRRLPMMQLDDVLAGTWYAKDGIADPNGVVMGYINGARRLGVKLFTDAIVTTIETRGGKVSAVVTNRGRIETPIVANAAGPWASSIGKMVDLDLPIVPIRRQWLTTTPLPNLPDDFPFVIDFAQSLYFHREGEGLLTGMSNPDQAPGTDQGVDREWELVAMEAAAQRVPLLETAGVVSRLAGLYEVTPDAHPILGATPLAGFYVCAGFSGHGFMHGPICGKLLAEEILNGRATTLNIDALRFDRFARRDTAQEYNVV